MTQRARRDLDYSTRGGVADVTSAFAGVVLLVTGSFDVLQGISAIANDNLYDEGADYAYSLDLTTWGVIHLIIGLLSIGIAIGILRRQAWGQVVGMIVAGIAILTNFAFLPLYPWWAIMIIALNVFVIWALSVQLRNYR